jgi:hypothetical protein
MFIKRVRLLVRPKIHEHSGLVKKTHRGCRITCPLCLSESLSPQTPGETISCEIFSRYAKLQNLARGNRKINPATYSRQPSHNFQSKASASISEAISNENAVPNRVQIANPWVSYLLYAQKLRGICHTRQRSRANPPAAALPDGVFSGTSFQIALVLRRTFRLSSAAARPTVSAFRPLVCSWPVAVLTLSSVPWISG